MWHFTQNPLFRTKALISSCWEYWLLTAHTEYLLRNCPVLKGAALPKVMPPSQGQLHAVIAQWRSQRPSFFASFQDISEGPSQSVRLVATSLQLLPLYPILISLLLYRCCSQKQPPIIHLHTNLKLRVCFPGNLGKNSKMTPMIFTFWYSHLCMTLSPWVSGACDLLLTDGIWWGWWHVTPMIRLQCRYKTPSCWHALKRLPCWLWSKLPYCERDYGEGHMERNNGWPLGAESSHW